jgi:hypothetical protein
MQIKGRTALLGGSNHSIFKYCDLYDSSLNNWDINSKWTLRFKYKTLISLKTHEAKNSEEFLIRCKNNMTKEGYLYLVFVLDGNPHMNQSMVWDQSFEEDVQFQKFDNMVGADDIADYILDNYGFVMKLTYIENHFELLYKKMYFIDDLLYVSIGAKK